LPRVSTVPLSLCCSHTYVDSSAHGCNTTVYTERRASNVDRSQLILLLLRIFCTVLKLKTIQKFDHLPNRINFWKKNIKFNRAGFLGYLRNVRRAFTLHAMVALDSNFRLNFKIMPESYIKKILNYSDSGIASEIWIFKFGV